MKGTYHIANVWSVRMISLVCSMGNWDHHVQFKEKFKEPAAAVLHLATWYPACLSIRGKKSISSILINIIIKRLILIF